MMGTIPDIAAAAVTLLVTLGGAARFIWTKIERKFGQQQQKLDHMQEQLDACKSREVRDVERRGVQLTVIELLWRELERLDMGSAALTRAKHLLDDLKKIAVIDKREVGE